MKKKNIFKKERSERQLKAEDASDAGNGQCQASSAVIRHGHAKYVKTRNVRRKQ
jgi:hypothetical protein